MKTLQEMYKEIMANEELKAKYVEASKNDKAVEFLKEQGCETTAEEIKAFMEEKMNEEAPLSLDELDNAAGGSCEDGATVSIFTIKGICAA